MRIKTAILQLRRELLEKAQEKCCPGKIVTFGLVSSEYIVFPRGQKDDIETKYNYLGDFSKDGKTYLVGLVKTYY